MELTRLFLADLDAEAGRSRKALEQVPEGQYDWKPHEKSMHFGYLSELVATMPSWVAMAVNQDSLDLKPTSGQGYKRPNLRTRMTGEAWTKSHGREGRAWRPSST
jgi:hypothetical protein